VNRSGIPAISQWQQSRYFRLSPPNCLHTRACLIALYILVALSFCSSPLVVLATRAGTWPDRPTVIIIPYKPGGGGETLIRLIMQQVGASTGQAFVMENRPGAGGTLGAGYVAKAPADGYTLLASGVGCCVVGPMFVHASFNPIRDFTPIALFGGAPPALVVNSKFESQTLQQYVDISHRYVQGITYASPGYGTHIHLIAEFFKSLSGANILHVPYAGGGPAIIDLISGNVSSAFVSLGTVAQYAKTGDLRILAVASRARLPDFPEVPTFAELGYGAMTSITWFGLSGPANLPRDIVLKLNAQVRKALAEPVVLRALSADSIEPNALGPEQFEQFVRAELARWTPIAKTIKETSPAQIP
jgi:tripartite-type tricarboxylate transporter receptor subunit TctC